MSLNDCKGTIAGAAKDLFARWNDVKDVWSDAQSREFEKNYLLPLEQDVRSALGALDQMNQVLQTIESDCE
jgi:hypothetical protein